MHVLHDISNLGLSITTHRRNFRGMGGPNPHCLEWEDGPPTL